MNQFISVFEQLCIIVFCNDSSEWTKKITCTKGNNSLQPIYCAVVILICKQATSQGYVRNKVDLVTLGCTDDNKISNECTSGLAWVCMPIVKDYADKYLAINFRHVK